MKINSVSIEICLIFLHDLCQTDEYICRKFALKSNVTKNYSFKTIAITLIENILVLYTLVFTHSKRTEAYEQLVTLPTGFVNITSVWARFKIEPSVARNVISTSLVPYMERKFVIINYISFKEIVYFILHFHV